MKNKYVPNQNIQMLRKIPLLFLLIIAIISLVLTGRFIYRKINESCCLPPSPPVKNNTTSNTYFSNNLSLSLELPPQFEASETRNKPFSTLTITNNLKVKYSSLKPETAAVRNYQLVITIKSGSFAKISRNIPIDKTVTLGPHAFQSGFIGAENEGEGYYFLKTLTTDDWLVAVQSIRDETRIPEIDKTQEGYLNNDRQQNYTEQILSSIKFTIL